jgi:hypothetical protein
MQALSAEDLQTLVDLLRKLLAAFTEGERDRVKDSRIP